MNQEIEFAKGNHVCYGDIPQTFVTSEVTSRLYEHYMDYDLVDFDRARQLCSLLRHIEEHDTLVIRINCLGGNFAIAAQIINAIRESEGRVVGVIEQECASAATMIFLACNEWQVQPYARMMVHTASYGVFGKAPEIASNVKYQEDVIPKIMQEIYKGFLTEDEVEDVVRGIDIYLTSEEILDRLSSLAEVRKQELQNKKEEDESYEEADQCSQVCSCSKK